MAKNFIDNLSEETTKGMLEKAEQSIYPSFAPIVYRNVMGPKVRVFELDMEGPHSHCDVSPTVDLLAITNTACKEEGRRN